jgi:hypothetical protein
MSTTPTPSANATPQTAPLSEGARIINTFIAPSKTFSDLQRKARWWVPWLLISVFSLAFIYTVDRQIGYEQVSANEIAKSSKRTEQLDKLPPDQKAKQLQISATITRIFSYGSPAVILLIYVIIAAVLLATFNLALGASVRFAVALAIVIYASLPAVLGALLGTVSIAAGASSGSLDKEAFNIQNPVATNPAYFMNPTGNHFAYSMASMLDVFVIWTIILMGIGFACNSKVKRGSAMGVVAGWYVFYKLLGAGIATLFS